MVEETVYKVWLIDSISVGSGGTPHTPPSGRNPPRTPGIKCIEALFNSLVYNKDSGHIGRKDRLCEVLCIGDDPPWSLDPRNNLKGAELSLGVDLISKGGLD
jgi:hypothetical protein